MKSSIFALAFAAFASAQTIDFDEIDAVPVPETTSVPIGAGSTTVAYNSATAAASAAAEITASPVVSDTKMRRDMKNRIAFDKRDGNCAVQPVGYGPVPDPDTADAFLADTDFSSAASAQTAPSGFVQSFTNLQASNSAYAYMGYTSLKTYDAATCATKCKAISGCNAFNIYFERDPSLDAGTNCPNPASTTVIKCVFWGGPVLSGNAKNTGQYRSEFEVVMAGSNGYNSAGPMSSPTGYTGTWLGQKGINAPLCNTVDTYLGVKTFTSGPFDPSLCAAACSAQSDYNRAHPASDGTFKTCQFYNTYMLMKNGDTGKQVCAMYSQSWDSSYATNTGSWSGSNHYTIEFSVTGSNTTTPATCAV